MKTAARILLLLSLVAAIFAGRWFWFYGGREAYQTPQIAEIQADKVGVVPTLDYRPFADAPVAGHGHVLIDLAHHNNLTRNDLSPLQSRLEARGATVEFFDGDVPLSYALYQTTALVVLAPSAQFAEGEQRAVAAFVKDGGRLFLAADPTRPAPPDDAAEDDEFAAFFPTSAIPAINSVANLFGITYFDDYLYNLGENVGNYRNVAFSPAEAQLPLTQDVETIVFFATHSMRSTGMALFKGDAAVASTVRTGEADLPAAILTADERVLALGDITFLTAPYHTVADNDRFLSHIADWLAEDTRVRNALEDFPYLFGQQVDLVQISGDLVDPRLIAKGGTLQTYFEETGRSLTLRTDVVPDHDALLVGLFSDVPTVQELLAQNGITLTTVVAADILPAVQPKADLTPNGATGLQQYLEIPAMGTLSVKGITLFIVDCDTKRCSISMVAETAEGVAFAVERLANHNFNGCARAGALTLCAADGAPEAIPQATEPAVKKRILILSVEDGAEGVRTSAANFVDILGDAYAVTLWTIPDDGQPTEDDLEGYDVYIIDSGDYTGGTYNSPAFEAIDTIDSGNVLLVGAQPLPVDTAEVDYAPINDLVVAETTHPLLEGLTAGELITLLPSESNVPAMVIANNDPENIVLLMRGPGSPSTGNPALIAAVDETSDVNRIVVAAFAFYRLPESVQRTLALNIAAWLVEDGQ